MSTSSREAILADIRQSLGRGPASPVAPRPPVLPPRAAGATGDEIAKLFQEMAALGGITARLAVPGLDGALGDLVKAQGVRKAVLWNTEGLARLAVGERLRRLGVDIIPTGADKQAMAEADLGVTEVDFALPETGTLGLLSSPDKPRSASLLPRVHLALISPRALRADLHQVFAEAKAARYLIFITGPSRTSDIELVVTIGVHGPQVLYAWLVDE